MINKIQYNLYLDINVYWVNWRVGVLALVDSSIRRGIAYYVRDGSGSGAAAT